MTYPISDVTRRVVYSGSAGTGPYTFTFEVLTQGDIGVYKNSTLLTLTTDYTVTINVDGTGYITLVSAATAADTIAIFGNKGIQRSTDFVTGGDLFANSLNDELDAQTIFAQQNAEAIVRSIRAPQFDPTGLDMTLDEASVRADKLLGFANDGSVTSPSTTMTQLDAAVASFVNATGNNAASILYDPAGTGAQQTTVQARLRETISVKDFGAVGDGVTDDTAAIQAAFDVANQASAAADASGLTGYALQLYARDYAVKITFPAGDYLVSDALTLGAPNKHLWYVTIDMDSAGIHSTHTGPEAALTIYTAQGCKFSGLNVLADTVTAINIKNSQNSEYSNISAGAGTGALAAIHCEGVHFNNTWNAVRMQQNVGTAGATYCWYWKCDTIIPPGAFAGGPINSFNGMWMANAPHSMYWEGGSHITITNVEHEGFNGPYAATDYNYDCALFKGINHLHISEVYQEALTVESNFLTFEDCAYVTLRNIKGGSYYHYNKIKNSRFVSIESSDMQFRYEGTNYYVSLNNIKTLRAGVYRTLDPVGTAYLYNLQAKNIYQRNQTDTTYVGFFPDVNTGRLAQSDNILLNPRCLDASGDVATQYCTCVNDASYQSVSPLGYIESVVEVDSTVNYLRLEPDFDSSKIPTDGKKIQLMSVSAWKARNVPAGFTAVTGTAGDMSSNQFYGRLTTFQYGDWILNYCQLSIDPASVTKSVFVHSYNNIFSIGDKFLFGGAIVYPGSDIRLPYYEEI